MRFSAFDFSDLEQMFNSPKVLKATLTLTPNDEKKFGNPILELKGIVTSKYFKRLPSSDSTNGKPVKIYEINFCDPAKATWEQHYPSNIYLEESMKDVIDKHLNPEIQMEFDWEPIEAKHPIIAFSLEHKHWLSIQEQTNFYSFLIWYLHQENGVLLYDYKKHNYKITGKKKAAEGDPFEIKELFCSPPVCILPLPPRYNTKVIKHSADLMDGEDKENEDSFKTTRRESIDPANYRVYPNQATEKIQSPLTSEKNEFEFQIREWGRDKATGKDNEIPLDRLIPGSYISFIGDGEGNWLRDECFKGKKFRIRSLHLTADKEENSQWIYSPTQLYEVKTRVKLEEEEETFVLWPSFARPNYPFYIQGKIFCEIGEEEQSTFNILESEEAPQGQYQVLVPLAGEEKKVVAPFVPAYSGQYYHPFIKDAKVMLSMYFHTARIERPIDWDPLARLPAGVQGNQIVLASNGKDKYTIIKHEYADGKDSVYTIKQSSSETQTQTLEIKEKEIKMTMDEKDKKTIFIQWSHESGLILSLEDKDAGSKQEIVFDGESMTHTCKGSGGTSTIVQKPDSVAIECKEFSVKSETITLDAKDTISQSGANKVNIKTNVANVSAPSVKLG